MKYISPQPVPAQHIRPGAEAGCYVVSSSSRPGVEYYVDIKAGTCSCPAGEHNFERCTIVGACKHFRGALALHYHL